jgi:hypothetical protein
MSVINQGIPRNIKKTIRLMIPLKLDGVCTGIVSPFLVFEMILNQQYTNGFKSWEFGKEAAQIFCLERATIAE